MEILSVLVSVFVILLFLWLFKRNNVVRIPGPMGLPIVGYIPFLTRKPYIKLAALGREYGSVYRIQLGSRDIVVLCDYNVIKEALSKDALMSRPLDIPFEISEESIRLDALYGLKWLEQRKFCMHMLSDLGFGKSRMEEHLKEEIQELLGRMEESPGSPIYMSDLLAPCTSNNIFSFIFGKRLKHNDPQRQRLDRLNAEIGKLIGVMFYEMFFPWTKSFINYFNIGHRKELSRALDAIRQFVMDEINEHERSLDSNNIRDFVDGYLVEIKKRRNDRNSTFTKEVLCDVCRGFFSAGSESVRMSVDWMLLLCADIPELQRRIHGEIDEVLGPDRFPSWQDRFEMPYTEASVYEMLRWKSTISFTVIRYTNEDTEVNGFHIPKHSWVLPSFYAVDHDESLWGKDVHEYKPERFLSKNRKKVIKPEFFIPFSLGKRSCPGKTLAEMEIFVYLCAILQRFEVSMPPGKRADLEGIAAIDLEPKRQELCFKLRHE